MVNGTNPPNLILWTFTCIYVYILSEKSSLAPRTYCEEGDCDFCLNEHCCHNPNGFNSACCVKIAKGCAGEKGGSNQEQIL